MMRVVASAAASVREALGLPRAGPMRSLEIVRGERVMFIHNAHSAVTYGIPKTKENQLPRHAQ